MNKKFLLLIILSVLGFIFQSWKTKNDSIIVVSDLNELLKVTDSLSQLSIDWEIDSSLLKKDSKSVKIYPMSGIIIPDSFPVYSINSGFDGYQIVLDTNLKTINEDVNSIEILIDSIGGYITKVNSTVTDIKDQSSTDNIIGITGSIVVGLFFYLLGIIITTATRKT